MDLRPLAASDAPDMFRLLEHDQAGIEQTGSIPWPFTLNDAEAWLTRVTKMDGVFAILVDGEFAGSCGVTDDPEDEHAAVLGFWVGLPFRGQGIASRAVERLVKIARMKRRLRVKAEAFPANTVSARVLEKHGLKRTGIVERNLPVRGGLRQSYTYELEL